MGINFYDTSLQAALQEISDVVHFEYGILRKTFYVLDVEKCVTDLSIYSAQLSKRSGKRIL